MARKEIIVTTCDKCYGQEKQDMQVKPGRADLFQLPDGWLHITGNTKRSTVFEMDLCGSCKQDVIEAAGRAA